MLSPMKRVLCEYHPLLMKMALDSPTIGLGGSNLKLCCDVEIMLSLLCLVPMLKTINALVKFS